MTDPSGPLPAPSPQQQWLHDMRNAVNAMGISLTVMQLALEQEDRTRALEFMSRAQSAAERCRALLDPSSPPP